MKPTLWFDVEDLLHYARHATRPSGIQRVTFEIYRALQQGHGEAGGIRFVRHAPGGADLLPVPWDEIDALFRAISERKAETLPPPPVTTPAVAAAPLEAEPPADSFGSENQIRLSLRRAANRLPTALRRSLVLSMVAQAQALAALGAFALGTVACLPEIAFRAARLLARRLRPRPALPPNAALTAAPEADAAPARSELAGSLVRPGDVLVVLGSPWFHEDYADLVSDLKARFGIRLAILIHDIIPLRRPEWCHHGVVRTFRHWHSGVLPLCDVVFSNSAATARDLETYAAREGIALTRPVQPLRMGTGFGLAAADAEPMPAGDPVDAPVPAGDYVLFVSTIEARKNHMLLFRVWRRLLDEMPRETVPTLVFAGRIGWLVSDLLQQLENAQYLHGKIVVIQEPTDATLRALYAGCLFTVFPSLYEGWGLPVTESLALGKPCVSSDRTSLPEAGGSLARYFDPENLHDATARIRAAIEDRADLAAWEARVRREFCPVGWSDAAETIAATLRALPP